MNTKKLIVFLLWAFLPMVIVGLVMHFSGTSTVGLPEDPSGIDPLVVIKGMVLSAGAMFTPMLAVIFTQLIFKEPVLKNLFQNQPLVVVRLAADAPHCICRPWHDASDAWNSMDT